MAQFYRQVDKTISSKQLKVAIKVSKNSFGSARSAIKDSRGGANFPSVANPVEILD